MNKPVITRFPPSPTGLFHIGSARTALFNYLFAKHYEGKMILRLEDTDKERSKDEFAENIFDGLKWLGIHHDGEIFVQSKRTAVYRKYLEQLVSSDKAYVSDEVVGEEGKRSSVIRFRNPKTPVTFHDEVRGDITMDPSDLGDFVLAKDYDTPLYHLAVVVDDYEMDITHIIRGEDGITNTPRQILIQEAIGASRPVYVHIPFILGPDKSKFSKRNGAKAVTEYRTEGYLPDALTNFIALLGWNPGDDREFFTMDELIKEFSLERLQTSAAVFNVDKLDWMNREYLLRMDEPTFISTVMPFIPVNVQARADWSEQKFLKLVPMLRERVKKLDDIRAMFADGEFDYVFSAPVLLPEKIVWKDATSESTSIYLEHAIGALEGISEQDWTAEKIKASLWDYATEKGRGGVLWPMRYGLTGRDKSPDPFTVAALLGKSETLSRLTSVRKQLF